MNEQYAIFHITSNDKQLLYGSSATGSSNLTGVSLRDIPLCTTSLENQLPSDYLLGFDNVDYKHSGVYSLEVVIFKDANQNLFLTSEVTLNGE